MLWIRQLVVVGGCGGYWCPHVMWVHVLSVRTHGTVIRLPAVGGGSATTAQMRPISGMRPTATMHPSVNILRLATRGKYPTATIPP